MYNMGFSSSRVPEVDDLIARDPKLQPTLKDEPIQRIHDVVLRDLRSGKTSQPAEAVARNLAMGGLMGHAGAIVLKAGGTRYAPQYGMWMHGLMAPHLLLDQAFAIVTMGHGPVLGELEGLVSQQGPLSTVWRIVRDNVVEANTRLRRDASGVQALDWFVEKQMGNWGDRYVRAGLLAALRLHIEFLTTLASEGYPAGGAIVGSPR
jgi:hypothetical protein